MNPTKRSLLTSIVALVLCLTTFLGTTFAWFTDVVSSSGNIIQSGTLDLDLMKGTKTDSGWNWESTEGKAIFDYDKWEPGYTASAVLAVENHGTLSAKWTAKLTLNGTPSILADVITIYVTSYHNYDTTRPDFSNTNVWTKLGTVSDVLNNDGTLLPGGVIDPGHRQPILVALHMDENAGNEYQEKSLGANFDITILATQATAESDSFGPDYDADAKWPDLASGYAASTPIDSNNLMLGALTSEVTIGGANGIGATVPADVMIADGATSLELTMKKVDSDNLNLGDDDSETSFDVHISGIAPYNEKPIIVNLGPVLEAGLDETELKLYHTENGTPSQMTRVATVSDFAIHNQYTYDPTNGNVSIFVKSFSVFSAVKTSADLWDGITIASGFASGDGTEANPYLIKTAAQLAYFRQQVDAGNTFKGRFVKLGADIDLADKPFDPIGFGYWSESKVDENDTDTNTVFMGTFDGGHHTIYNLYQNGWELDPDKSSYSTYTYSTAGAGLFASIKNATIKNLAVSGAEIVFECVDMGIVVGYAQGTCHFENIVVTDSNIANYNRYTGGVVGEVSYGPYGIDTSLGYSHTFKNITVDSTVTVSGLWGSFGCGMGGVIGGKWGDATVYMENVISAPVMDVYNDVVSAYQWYAFRGCGMLIGHTEEPESDGRKSGNATAGFLKCEDVYVYYGDWVNYHYYEFAKQDSDTGKKYPWVRAEKGEYCDAFSNIRYGVPTHNGVKVSDLTEEELKAKATNYTPIVFNQLYGADRGMYGTDKHDGVTVAHKNTKTIYFMNANKWTDLKLHYYYVNGDDTWTNVPDGISLGEAVNKQGTSIYKVTVPVYANELYITGATEEGVNTTRNASVAELVDGYVYYMTVDQIKHCEYKEGYKTVYFENNKNWTNVSLYYWCNDGQADWGTIEFPGEKMNLVSSEGIYDVYSFVIPAYATGFVFSDGKENVTGTNHYQSVDVKLTSDPDGKIFYLGDIDYSQVVDGNKVNYKYNVYSTEYKSGYTTVYFQNNWLWEDVQIYYSIDGSKVWSKGEIKLLGYNGNNEYYSAILPNYATKFNISGERDVSSERQQTVNLSLSNFATKNLITLSGGSGTNVSVKTSTYSASTKLTGYRTIYLKLGDWNKDGAWFQAWTWGGDQDDAWVTFRDLDGDGIYEANIPEDREGMNILRKGSSHSKKTWTFWNRTGNITIFSDKNMCTITNHWNAWDNNKNSGGASGSWSTKP